MPKKYIVWTFDLGYRHGFETDCENWRGDKTIHEYEWIKPDKTVKNQGDYLDVCIRHLPRLLEIREYPWTDEGLLEGLNRGDLRIYDDYSGWLDPDYEEDAAMIAGVGGLAAWAAENGVVTYGWKYMMYMGEQ